MSTLDDGPLLTGSNSRLLAPPVSGMMDGAPGSDAQVGLRLIEHLSDGAIRPTSATAFTRNSATGQVLGDFTHRLPGAEALEDLLDDLRFRGLRLQP
jgi:hypothetical protein